jgi:hypothetical protein
MTGLGKRAPRKRPRWIGDFLSFGIRFCLNEMNEGGPGIILMLNVFWGKIMCKFAG